MTETQALREKAEEVEQRKLFVSPFGSPSKWRFVTTRNARRQANLVGFNRYPRQIIGIVVRLPDGEGLNGKKSFHSLSIVWSKPSRWWK